MDGKKAKPESGSNSPKAKPNENKKSGMKRVTRSYKLLKLLGYLVILIALPAYYVFTSPFFTLNLDNPLDSAYIELPPLVPYEGVLAPNDKLTKAKYIAHKKLVGPETIVFTPEGQMYTGITSGHIVRVEQDGTLVKIAQIGDEPENNCAELSIKSNPKCGRPLGLRLLENSLELYVADAYFGIVKVNLSSGKKTPVLSANDPRFGNKPLKLTDDLDIDGDTIYLIDSSYDRIVDQALEAVLEAQPRGRLFSYNQKTDELELLMENLYFPNGLQLGPDKDYILINECTASRIIKFWLKGSAKGKSEVFANLPGHGDTIRLTEANTLLVPICGARPPPRGAILDALGQYPLIRNFLFAVVDFDKLIHTDILMKHGLLVEYDLKGNVLKSWHDSTGKTVSTNTNAVIYRQKLYIGSFLDDYIAVADY